MYTPAVIQFPVMRSVQQPRLNMFFFAYTYIYIYIEFNNMVVKFALLSAM